MGLQDAWIYLDSQVSLSIALWIRKRGSAAFFECWIYRMK